MLHRTVGLSNTDSTSGTVTGLQAELGNTRQGNHNSHICEEHVIVSKHTRLTAALMAIIWPL